MTKPKISTKNQSAIAPSEWSCMLEQLLQWGAILAVAAVVAFIGIAVVERHKKNSLPFCDPYQSESCVPCPENARCIGGNIECIPGFIRHGKACSRDQEIEHTVQKVEKLIVRKVCGYYTLPFCKRSGSKQLTVLEATQLLESSELEEMLEISSEKLKFATQEGLTAAKNRLLLKENEKRLLELECPNELLEYHKPYWCRTQEWIARNYSTLFILISLMLLAAIFLGGAYHKRKVSKRVEQLYNQVCKALEERSWNHAAGMEKWIVASHLRDHLLTIRERQDNTIWSMVDQMVCSDSRIDQYPKLVKGESKVVWEWQVEGALKEH